VTKALFRLARWPIVVACGVLTALFLLYFSATERAAPEGTPGVLELELAFTADRFDSIVDQWAESGTLAVQQRNLWLDLFFPFAYATFLCGLVGLLVARFSEQPRTGLVALAMLPLVAGALDWVENGLLILLLESVIGERQLLVTVASAVSSAKWILLLVSLMAVVCLLLRRAIQAIGR
jgi:hypothetical protein